MHAANLSQKRTKIQFRVAGNRATANNDAAKATVLTHVGLGVAVKKRDYALIVRLKSFVLCKRIGRQMKGVRLCTGIHEKTDVPLTIHLIVGGEILTQEGKDQGKHQRVHAHSQEGRLARHKDTLACWGDRQKDAWSQQHEQDGGHDHVSWAQGYLEHKLGNQVVHQGQNQGVDQHWAGTHAQEQAWAEQSEQDGWCQNLGAGDIHVGRYYLPRKLSDKLGKVVEGCLVHQRAGEVIVLEVLTKGHPHVEDILRVPVVPI